MARFRFLFIWSFYFILIIFFAMLSGVYQPYDSEGSKLCILLIMCNFYVIVLQMLWRTYGQSDSLRSEVHCISNTSDIENIVSYNTGEKTDGIDYYKSNYEIALKKAEKPLRPTAIFPNNEETMCKEEPEKPPVEKTRSSNLAINKKVDRQLEYVDEPISEKKLENSALFLRDDNVGLRATGEQEFTYEAFDEEETIANIPAEDIQQTDKANNQNADQIQEMEPKFIWTMNKYNWFWFRAK